MGDDTMTAWRLFFVDRLGRRRCDEWRDGAP
jgi:hypothetical protein